MYNLLRIKINQKRLKKLKQKQLQFKKFVSLKEIKYFIKYNLSKKKFNNVEKKILLFERYREDDFIRIRNTIIYSMCKLSRNSIKS